MPPKKRNPYEGQPDLFGTVPPTPPQPVPVPHRGGGTPAGEAGAVEGMERAATAAPNAWKDEVYRAIAWLAERQSIITGDDVWAAVEGRRPGFEARLPLRVVQAQKKQALGSLMRRAATAGLIVNTHNVVSSSRGIRHNGTHAEWRSLRYQAS